jgi:hypothetical protein
MTVGSVRANAVILDGGDDIVCGAVDRDEDGAGAGVALHIRQTLLDDAVERLRNVGCAHLRWKVDAELDAQSCRLREIGDEPLQRLFQG